MVLLVGCGAVHEDMDPARAPRPEIGGVPVAESPAPASAVPAIDAILTFYRNAVGVDIKAEVPLQVHWTPALPGTLLGATTHSLGWGCSSWIVDGAMFSYPKVLPHELGHCARWLLTGDGDSAHTDPAWWGADGYVMQALAAEVAAGVY